MYAARRIAKKGFTLVEILIVVIILGILAAIVIPQFTSASDDARKNSLTSQVQTLRSQIELYKLQHTTDGSELFGVPTDATTTWQQLTKPTAKTTGSLTVGTDVKCGPYLQTTPTNGMNGDKALVYVDASVSETSSGIDPKYGFAYNPSTGKFFGVAKDGTAFLGN